jgi:hypothetical protein
VGPIARKLISDLRREERRGVVDLAAYREARDRAAERADDVGIDGLPAANVFWMLALRELARCAFVLLNSKHLGRLARRIEQSEEEYMPGGPPSSPLLDSFHIMWCLTGCSIGRERETLGSIALDVAAAFKIPEPVRARWREIAGAYPGVYEIVEVTGDAVTVVEIVGDRRHEVAPPPDVPAEPGGLWWTWLLPPAGGDRRWASITTPYLIDGTVDEWRAYFERAAGAGYEAYRRHLVSPPEPNLWLDYILDGYAGVCDSAVVLVGLPDRPSSLPHSLESGATPLESLRARLGAIGGERGHLKAALDEFASWRYELAGLDEPLDDWHEAEQILMYSHGLYEAVADDGTTAIDHLEDLEADEAAVLAEIRAGWFSVFEVLRVVIDEGFEVRDVLRRRRLWVSERAATRGVAVGDLLATRILIDGERVTLEGASYRVPRVWADQVIERCRELMGELRASGKSWRERHAAFPPIAAAAITAAFRAPLNVALQNTDGEDLLLCEAVYDIADEPALLAALDRDELEASGDSSYSRIEGRDRTVTASFELAGGRLRVQTNSRARHERTRRWLAEVAGASIAHRADTFQDVQSSAASASPATRERPPVPEAVIAAAAVQIQAQLLDRLDEPIPMFGGKSLRQMARSARGRDEAAAWLLEQERILAQGQFGGALDFRALWTELGLEYPRPRV